MSPPCKVIRTAIVLLVAGALCSRASAQQLATAVDTEARSGNGVTAWASAGFGEARIRGSNGSPIAVALRASASISDVVVMARFAEVGPFLVGGDGVDDAALLVGVRSGGHRLFATATVGYSRVTPYHGGGIDGPARTTGLSQDALAYDLGIHANLLIPGLSLGLSGDLGPPRIAYTAIVLSMELGWFGK